MSSLNQEHESANLTVVWLIFLLSVKHFQLLLIFAVIGTGNKAVQYAMKMSPCILVGYHSLEFKSEMMQHHQCFFHFSDACFWLFAIRKRASMLLNFMLFKLMSSS